MDYSRCKVERILESRGDGEGGEKFRCKFEGQSYRRTTWLPYDVLAGTALHCAALISTQ